MKKIFLFLFISYFLFSCSSDNEESLVHVNLEKTNSKTTKSAGDEKYDVLGYGYFITKPYASRDAVSQYQVLDIEKMVTTEPSSSVYFDKGAYSGTATRVYSGEDYESYTKEVASKTNFSASAASNGLTSGLSSGLFSADVKASQEAGNKASYSTAYSYSVTEIISNYRRFLIDTELSTAHKYLNPYFKEELEKVNTSTEAYNLVAKFGTHVLFKFTTGGVFKSEFKGLAMEDGTSNTRKQTAEAGAKFGLSAIGLGASVGWEQTTTTQINNKNVTWSCDINSYGGSTNGLTINISPTAGTSYSLSLASWTSSINDKNAVLVDLDWNKTYPLHMLITDETKANLVREAINTYVKNNKFTSFILSPLYGYWNNKRQEAYLTNTYESKSGWSFDKIIGYTTRERSYGRITGEGGESGTLYQVKHLKNDNLFASASLDKGGEPKIKDYENSLSKAKNLGVIQLSEPSNFALLTSLYRFWNKGKNTYYYTTDINDSKIKNSNWVFDGTMGYILYR